ncbi:polysaccharide biosynthesis/export family protein [Flavobacterium sp.]|uniref:polysaccharide biosynthesis/export family protein n=1 Tax=Flavobacterium sp. TaxID=239 RepID=UPI00375239D2
MKKYVLFFSLIFLFSLNSCISSKKIVYLQGNQESAKNDADANYEPLVQNDDMLYINVSSFEPGAATPFNLETPGNDENTSNANYSGGFIMQKQTYLVDNYGNITFPVIGKIKVSGYKITDLKELIRQKVSLFVTDAVVNIRIINFKISVMGEVATPGIVTFDSQRVTLLDALAKAGDLTIFGKRENILLIRDFQGVKTFNRIDITKADFVNSPFYYLDQNDVIYVEPRKSKIDSAAVGSNFGVIVSLVSLSITVLVLLTK